MNFKYELTSVLDEKVNSIMNYVKNEGDISYTLDPVFNIKRNRVNAELVKTLVRTQKEPKITKNLINFMLKGQNHDGSWNEVHPKYSQPSSLITSIVGESLLMAHETMPELEQSIHIAKDYVLSQEFGGKFIKSQGYTADHLNVDVTCGSFLARYGKTFSDEECTETALRTGIHICNNQFKDGSFPYTTNKGNYSQNLNIPCIHYQGVTLYYLSKIHEFTGGEKLKDSILHGSKWLSGVQKDDGKFEWSKSGLMFAYYLSGAYGFGLASFIYASKWDKSYLDNAYKMLKIINENSKGLMLRWEKDDWRSLPSSTITTVKTANIGDYPLKHMLFRGGYGFYRQIARRRYSEEIDERLFKIILKISKMKVSTIEPFNNYPDMFMTSEVLDCLSYSLNQLR